MKFEWNYKDFHSRKCCLQNGIHFAKASMCWIALGKFENVFTICIYYNFLTLMVQVVEIFPHGSQGSVYPTWSIPMLQHQWYWPSSPGIFWSQHQKRLTFIEKKNDKINILSFFFIFIWFLFWNSWGACLWCYVAVVQYAVNVCLRHVVKQIKLIEACSVLVTKNFSFLCVKESFCDICPQCGGRMWN